ncbi:MAG: hypothetical protein IJE60_00500 [Tyzzerella sp.]|nr:hypothetical protein [Tyzzerella sp.]
MATDIQRFNLLLFNGNLNPNSSTIGGTTIKKHRGKTDLSDVIAGKSINTEAVRTLKNSGTNRHSIADESIVLMLKS